MNKKKRKKKKRKEKKQNSVKKTNKQTNKPLFMSLTNTEKHTTKQNREREERKKHTYKGGRNLGINLMARNCIQKPRQLSGKYYTSDYFQIQNNAIYIKFLF